MSIIRLKSNDDQVFDVDVRVAMCSNTIRNMLNDLGIPVEDDEESVPLPNVPGRILKKVLEWADYHRNDPPVDEEDDDFYEPEVCDWDREFLKVDMEVLKQVILVANYLDIPGLLESGCKILADMIRGKRINEIREICEMHMQINRKRKYDDTSFSEAQEGDEEVEAEPKRRRGSESDIEMDSDRPDFKMEVAKEESTGDVSTSSIRPVKRRASTVCC